MPPAIPRESLPPHLQRAPPVHISDISKQQLNEIEAREELAKYIVIRFEKIENDILSDMEPEKGTWKHVTPPRSPLSKREAAAQVLRLAREQSLSEKKAHLGHIPADSSRKRRTISSSANVITGIRPTWCRLDHQVRFKSASLGSKHHQTTHDQKSSSSSRPYHENPSSRRRSQATLSDPIKTHLEPGRLLETVSLTAYYKQCLKPEFDALATLIIRDTVDGNPGGAIARLVQTESSASFEWIRFPLIPGGD